MKKFTFWVVFFFYFITLNAQETIVWSQDGHPDGLQVNSVAFSPDGTRVLSGTNCHPAKLRLFDAADGNIVWDYTLALSYECMMSVGMSANSQYIATAEETGKLMLFDYLVNPPALKSVLDLGTTYAFAVDFSPNSEKVAIGASNGKLRTYSLPSGTAELNINAHPGAWVMAVDYSTDNTKIATGSSDNKVKIFDAATGALLSTLSGHTNDVVTVKFTPDNQRVISGAYDHQVKIWDANTGALLHTIDASEQVINSLDISPDGAFLATVANDDQVSLWRLDDYSQLTSILLTEYGSAMSVSWSPVADVIAVGTVASKVVLFDISGAVSGVNEADDATMVQVAPSPFLTSVSVSVPDGNILGVQLLDGLGNLIADAGDLTGQVSYTFQNLAGLPAGVYVIKATTTDQRLITRRVVKTNGK